MRILRLLYFRERSVGKKKREVRSEKGNAGNPDDSPKTIFRSSTLPMHAIDDKAFSEGSEA
jgi:hypothetical protein